MLLGRNQGIAPYTHIVSGDKLYSSGYPGGPVYVYDPKLPWTVYKGGPPGHPAPPRSSARSNPRELGGLEELTRMAIAHSSAQGADGKLYFGGFGQRSYTGGGFGWYDPKTDKFGGFWKPLSGYAVYWMAPCEDSNLIAISTSSVPDELRGHRAAPEAKLFFYDIRQQAITREIVPVPKARTTGLITEVAPGRLLGLTVDGVEPGRPGRGVLYGLDVPSGDVLFQKILPWPVGTDPYWPHWVDPSFEDLALVRGPDGCLWTFLKNVLIRIDPKDAGVHVIGKLDPIGRPTFVGSDLYFSGPEQLRRIRNIARK